MAHRAPRMVAAVGAAALLTGCAVASPMTTQRAYAPSDGVRVQAAEGVVVENLLILTEGEGEPGYVLGAVVNRSQEDAEVVLTVADTAPVPVRVAAGETVDLTAAGITTAGVELRPGSTVPGDVAVSGVGAQSVYVPVLDGTIPPYDEFLAER